MTEEEKGRLMAAPVTLNGYKAIMSGRGMPFARIWAMTERGEISVQWSWPAVARIVASGGAFTL